MREEVEQRERERDRLWTIWHWHNGNGRPFLSLFMNAATGLCFAVNQRRSKQQGPRTKDLKWRLRLRLLFQLLPYCAYVLVYSIQFGLHRPCERSHCHYLYRSSSGSGYVSISGYCCFCWPFNMALLFFVLPLFTQASRTSDPLCYIMQAHRLRLTHKSDCPTLPFEFQHIFRV